MYKFVAEQKNSIFVGFTSKKITSKFFSFPFFFLMVQVKLLEKSQEVKLIIPEALTPSGLNVLVTGNRSCHILVVKTFHLIRIHSFLLVQKKMNMCFIWFEGGPDANWSLGFCFCLRFSFCVRWNQSDLKAACVGMHRTLIAPRNKTPLFLFKSLFLVFFLSSSVAIMRPRLVHTLWYILLKQGYLIPRHIWILAFSFPISLSFHHNQKVKKKKKKITTETSWWGPSESHFSHAVGLNTCSAPTLLERTEDTFFRPINFYRSLQDERRFNQPARLARFT